MFQAETVLENFKFVSMCNDIVFVFALYTTDTRLHKHTAHVVAARRSGSAPIAAWLPVGADKIG